MKNIYLTLIVALLFAISCIQQQNEDDYIDSEAENTDKEEELVSTDFNELEEKMDEIMYESDKSDKKVTKDVAVIKSKGAKEVKVNLDIGAGRLILSGGASELLTGGFIYSEDEWKPKIEYKVKNERGVLSISQPGNTNFNIGDDDKYVWNLKFNNKIPLDFNVDVGAGLSEIALSDLNLEQFRMDLGVGKTEIDLRGNWSRSTEIYLDGGIGLTQVYIPDNVGVELKVTKGIGAVDVKNMTKKGNAVYVNNAVETSKILIKIYLKTGIGKIEVE